jgi:hypothetical protein
VAMGGWPFRSNHRGDAGVRLRKTDLDLGRHSAFFEFANHYWCRAADPCEGKSVGRRAVRSPGHTGASDAAHSPLELIWLTPSLAGSGRGRGQGWLLLSAALAGRTRAVSDRARATNNPRLAIDDVYIDQCMAARGYLLR